MTLDSRRSWEAGAAALAAVLLVLFLASIVPSPGTPSSSSRVAPWSPAPYSEELVALPGFNPLYGYVHGANCLPGPSGCFEGGTNYSQVPVLSSDSTQPLGIYYVDNASNLDEYSLTSRAVRTIAHVTLLYQTWAAYGGMLNNEFFVEYASDEALFFGTTTPGAPDVSVETVNLTTGMVQLVNTGIALAPENQQPILLDDDTVLVISTSETATLTGCIDCPAIMTGVNVATGHEWSAGSLPFFEANNIYWLPQLHQLINIEAHGALGDQVEQLNESVDPNGDIVFSAAQTIQVDSDVAVDWVNGIGYNASAGRIAYSVGGLGTAVTYILEYGPQGLLSTQGEVRYLTASDSVVRGGETFDGQRYVYTSDWVMGGFYNGTQYVFDPWNGTVVPTNEPFTDFTGINVCDADCFLGTFAPSLAYVIDFHASLARNDPFWTVVLATSH